MLFTHNKIKMASSIVGLCCIILSLCNQNRMKKLLLIGVGWGKTPMRGKMPMDNILQVSNSFTLVCVTLASASFVNRNYSLKVNFVSIYKLMRKFKVLVAVVARTYLPNQCRLNHGPNGPMARAPELQGPRAAGQRYFLLLNFGRQKYWSIRWRLNLSDVVRPIPAFLTSVWPNPRGSVSQPQGFGRGPLK